MTNLLVIRILVSPADILGDRSGKEHILLKDHRDGIAEHFKIIVPDIGAADLHTSFAHVIETRDQLHERRLR